MLNVYDRPALALLIKECKEAGIQNIILVINESDKDSIIRYLRVDQKLNKKLKEKNKLKELEAIQDPTMGLNIKIAFQDQQLGDGHAVLQGIYF